MDCPSCGRSTKVRAAKETEEEPPQAGGQVTCDHCRKAVVVSGAALYACTYFRKPRPDANSPTGYTE